jgi:hypothetical protein
MEHEEDILQANICLTLSALGVWFFAVPNSAAGKVSMARSMRLRATGLRAGVSDLVVMRLDGGACFMEIKTKKRKLSPAQDNFRILCLARGWRWGIARSVEDALDLCRAWAII